MSGFEATSASATPTILEPMCKRLAESIGHIAGLTMRLQRFVDSIVGPVPTPDGGNKSPVPVSTTLDDYICELERTVLKLRETLDRTG